MPHDLDPRTLGLEEIASRCAQETQRFRRGEQYDPRFGFELFRRAFVLRDERAWEAIYRQYRQLVAGWVNRHPAFGAHRESADYFVNRAFEKMWSAITPARFAQFTDLTALMRYLQMCVGSAILDHVRASDSPAGAEDPEALLERVEAADPATEEQVMDQDSRQALWAYIQSRLRDEKERVVVECSFVLDLAPRHIQAQFPDLFTTVSAVSRVKENILDRLRRDAELGAFLARDQAAGALLSESRPG